MAKYKEIEYKWQADHVSRSNFSETIKSLFQEKKIIYKGILAEGPDYYYSNSDGYVIRHRNSADINEITLKLREKSTGITVRKEINIPLSKESTVLDMQSFLRGLGFKNDVKIHKSCDIFYIKNKKAEIDIVWYQVTSAGRRPKVFIEVEVAQTSEKYGLKILKKWAKLLEKTFKLKEKSDLSLYEIYSGKRYRSA
jgi:adenylate cyclase class IV